MSTASYSYLQEMRSRLLYIRIFKTTFYVKLTRCTWLHSRGSQLWVKA